MTKQKTRLVLWTGAKHSGKTTGLFALVNIFRERGLVVAGFLAPAIYEDERLTGFEGLDLGTGRRCQLATRSCKHAPFIFTDDGRELGRQALSHAAYHGADVVVVDEFGPYEFAGDGWRPQVDLLLRQIAIPIILVVRNTLIEDVRKLYKDLNPIAIKANEKDASDLMLRILF
ncbi:MAG: nucleoside-triphosphatase [Phycisphaerae bacterium]|jgi:nucleoside-triphosphatase THEP1